MKEEILPKDLETFSRFLADNMGLSIHPGKEVELKAKFVRAAKTFGFENHVGFLDFLSKTDFSKKHIIALAKDLTVGETYFFRHHPTYKALKENILPGIIARKSKSSKRIKIWSAGCCTGEEPYSIAILLKQLIPNPSEWDITILGTDINVDYLQKAKSATYNEWSFRDTSQQMRNAYFTKVDDKFYAINSEIREMVRFEFINLIERSQSSSVVKLNQMDLILCNNVLIYFTQEKIKGVIERFSDSLCDKGWLIVSTIEAPYVENEYLFQEKVDGLFFFRKSMEKKKELEKQNNSTAESLRLIEKQQEIAEVDKYLRSISQKEKINDQSKERKNDIETQQKWEGDYAAKDYEKTIEQLERILCPHLDDNDKLHNLSHEILYLSKAFANLGNIFKAKEWCEKGLQVNKVDPHLNYLHGILLQEVGCYEESIKAYQKALFLDPTFIMAHFSLGSISLDCLGSKSAKRHLRNALELLKGKDSNEILFGTDDLEAERIKLITENLIKDKRFEYDE